MKSDNSWQTALPDILSQIELICENAKRPSSSLRLLFATKTVSTETLRSVAKSGYRLFGENRVQELKEKYSELEGLDIEWHMIGHLQTNKVKDVLPRCQLIHSVDRLELAEAIQSRAKIINKKISVLIEVNTSGEITKHGLMPKDVTSFCEQIQHFDYLQVRGLMTLAKDSRHEHEVRPCFELLREKFDELKLHQFPNHHLTELSMGMSGDYQWAIKEGSTILRLGSAIFGSRT